MESMASVGVSWASLDCNASSNAMGDSRVDSPNNDSSHSLASAGGQALPISLTAWDQTESNW